MNERIRPYLRDRYTSADLAALGRALEPAVGIRLVDGGFLAAAERDVPGDDPTNYDAVWVRDSMWAFLAFRSEPASRDDARKVIKGMLRYFATPAQLARLRAVIADPPRAADPMNVLHIRFDARTLDDVQVDGKPQQWNHKQNDALGLFYQGALDALSEGLVTWDELTEGEWEILTRLPEYFERIRFWEMEDAGAWEEIERINSSSVGLVVSALETLQATLARPGTPERFRTGSDPAPLVEAGYERLFRQLPHESPAYPEDSPKYREADAALLCLVYPARLSRLTDPQRRAILDNVRTLVGDVGIRRYFGDAYQSGNYWARGGDTDDCSGAGAFLARTARMIPDTEAQWFFDSWAAVCYARIGMTGEATKFFNRALAQVTSEGATGADGNPVPAFSLPESYNTLVTPEGRQFAPSPITPLNWAKCSARLAVQFLSLVD